MPRVHHAAPRHSRKPFARNGDIIQMSRIQPPDMHSAPEETRPALVSILEEQGYVPHLYRLMAMSPALMAGWTGLQSALETTLDPQMRNAIALAVSYVSACKYCISGHSYMSERFTRQCMRDPDLQRRSDAESGRRAAAARFASALVSTRGQMSDRDLDEVRSAGFTDREILEIVAASAQFLLTNMLAGVAQLDIDVPNGEYGWMA